MALRIKDLFAKIHPLATNRGFPANAVRRCNGHSSCCWRDRAPTDYLVCCRGTNWRQPRVDIRQCFHIRNEAERLDCYDKRIVQIPPHPARGANAPVSIFGPKVGDVDRR